MQITIAPRGTFSTESVAALENLMKFFPFLAFDGGLAHASDMAPHSLPFHPTSPEGAFKRLQERDSVVVFKSQGGMPSSSGLHISFAPMLTTTPAEVKPSEVQGTPTKQASLDKESYHLKHEGVSSKSSPAESSIVVANELPMDSDTCQTVGLPVWKLPPYATNDAQKHTARILTNQMSQLQQLGYAKLVKIYHSNRQESAKHGTLIQNVESMRTLRQSVTALSNLKIPERSAFEGKLETLALWISLRDKLTQYVQSDVGKGPCRVHSFAAKCRT